MMQHQKIEKNTSNGYHVFSSKVYWRTWMRKSKLHCDALGNLILKHSHTSFMPILCLCNLVPQAKPSVTLLVQLFLPLVLAMDLGSWFCPPYKKDINIIFFFFFLKCFHISLGIKEDGHDHGFCFDL
jgi:hypothetical protein